ncbi:hypothetical protein [Burkholderia glumae]|uniref:hypothetical protein n=1 Tax=Burkholderia glumae TaxID=337 RepID=UPI00157A770D|nr:hypothetical protein [Burkholderia glumae]QKM47708.1 hypothetical protein B7760_01732 [Burkholderia glumae]QTP33477.1 hypothetical protein B7759_02071 [Burkholderia glumae]
MNTIAMFALDMPHEASIETAMCAATTVSLTAPLALGDQLTGPTIPDGATITNVVLSAVGLDGERPQEIRFEVVLGSTKLITNALPSYQIASASGFAPIQASGQVNVNVTVAPKVPAIGSVTLMVYFTPPGA